MKLANKTIDDKSPVFIIAEAGVNHNNNYRNALDLIHAAKKAGCDAVKFQAGENRLPFKWIPKLKEYCKIANIIFLCSITDIESLEALGEMPAYKIPSKMINNHKLLKAVKEKNKPIILSTGGARLDEIIAAVQIIHYGIILHCNFQYPTKLEDINLNAINLLHLNTGVVGFSDHTKHPIKAPIAAVIKGAKVIEKHFTLDKKMKGPDHKFSLEPDELKQMVKAIRETEEMIKPKTLSRKELKLKEKHFFKPKKIIAVIQARMGSTRLPGKVLEKIGNKTVLQHIVDNLKQTDVDNIIVATSRNKKDDAIEQWCIRNNVSFYRGSENNVIDRITKTARQTNAEWVLRVCGDCPHIHKDGINELIKRTDDKYAIIHNVNSYPKGMEAELINFKILETVNEKKLTKEEREHVTLYIKKHYPQMIIPKIDSKYHNFNLTLDTQEDLEFLRLLNKGIYTAMRVDGSHEIGFGHLVRCRLLAEYLDNVVFITRDYKEALDYLKPFPVLKIPKKATEKHAMELTHKYIKDFKINKLIIDLLKTKINLCKGLKGVKTIGLDILGEQAYKPDIMINRSIIERRWKKADYKGAKYAVMHPDFKKPKIIKKHIKRILICFGGSDPKQYTTKIVHSLCGNKRYRLDVVLGPGEKNHIEIKGINYHRNISQKQLARLMQKADLAVTASGSMLYQLVAIGLPAVTYVSAEWEHENAIAFHNHRTIFYNLNNTNIQTIIDFNFGYINRLKMHNEGRKLVDGKGLKRVLKIINEISK